ncbi:MAG: hypothetical protein R8P61_08485 [Bacteroidia bacterium]|nr:hypothetical protein [Bacteroidia bacterium]
MKSWFEYEYGYLNVDAENMYFTNTGNGSELRTLKEMPFGKKVGKKKHPFLFLGSMVFPFCFFLFDMGLTGQSITVMACFLLVFYFVYNYLKKDMGISMWIPLERIELIEIKTNFARISYRDPQEQVQSVPLDKIGKDGIEILTRLKSHSSQRE